MPQPRYTQVSPKETPYYHIVSRCVRRTFLCGTDHASGNCYEHRRQWIEDRIRLLSSVFTVSIAAYAVMSNHYHLVVKLCPAEAEHWSTREVLERWTVLYKGPWLVQRYLAGEPLSEAERKTVHDMAEVYRKRLTDLSWFMKCLNEPIARQANAEDGCTGHFWESRFKSQPLLTEQALLTCMAYVDLNPVRAGIASTPESSEHTSIRERIKPVFNLDCAIRGQQEQGALNCFTIKLKPLLHFDGSTTADTQTGLPFHPIDYLQLVEQTGRVIRPDKRGHIQHDQPILKRLGYSEDDWLIQATGFETQYQAHHSRRAIKQAQLKAA